jgi:endonuclease/exonuclease/phosphatase family metal-dependent hydrolase
MRRLLLWMTLVGAVAVAAAAAPAVSEARAEHTLRVMTRNLYLGADLAPALHAQSLSQLNDAAGEIFNQVRENDFPVRARGLAQEILTNRPDLVGLQEAALWRTKPTLPYFRPSGAFSARHVAYDYLKLLLTQLNRGKTRYRVVATQAEFDFETEANLDASPDHSCDQDVRLTMRDAILARVHDGVVVRHVAAGHFPTLLAPKLVGLVPVPVTRGWLSAQVSVRGSRWLRFVDTHLESFDDQADNPTNLGTQVGHGQVREAQAEELIGPGGPAAGRSPVILVGDLNSDVRTPLMPGDGLADQALLRAGFRERSTYHPLSCCLNTAVLASPGGGRAADFNHKVDHVMTNDPRAVTLIRSLITGRRPVHGFWDSDHAGTFSVLAVR